MYEILVKQTTPSLFLLIMCSDPEYVKSVERFYGLRITGSLRHLMMNYRLTYWTFDTLGSIPIPWISYDGPFSDRNYCAFECLKLAARSGEFDIAKYYLENFEIDNYPFVIQEASLSGNLDLVKYLVEKTKADGRHAPIEWSARNAAFKGHVEIIKYFAHESLNSGYRIGWSHVIDDACEGGHLNVIKHIIEVQKVRLGPYEIGDKIIIAARKGQTEIVNYFKQ